MAIFKKTSELPVKTVVNPGDRLVLVSSPSSSPNTVTVDVVNLFSNASANGFSIVGPVATPANSSSMTVKAGSIMWDANFLYVATANNTVLRVALQSF